MIRMVTVRVCSGASIALMVLYALSTASSAQVRDDGAPAESLGLGDNVHASVWGPAALYANPAGLVRVRTVIAEVTYNYLEGDDGHAIGIKAVDSKTNDAVALGIAYDYVTGSPGGVGRDGHQFRSGMATAYRSEGFALYAGFGLRYLGLEVGKDDDETDETNDVDVWSIDTGLILDLGSRIRFGVAGLNLLDTKTAEAPRKLGLGLAFNFETLDVTADLELDLTDDGDGDVQRYGFGVQYGIGSSVFARAGVVIDLQTGQERLSGGLGYSTNAWAIDLAYSSAVSGDTDGVFGISVRYVPPASGGR